MSLVKELDKLEEKFFGELEENRDGILPELQKHHKDATTKGSKESKEFAQAVVNRFGGIYIPYLFWVELASFLQDNENRKGLFGVLEEFAQSSFEPEEQKKMKSLLITYFAMEKEFELDKIQSLIIEKAHPKVQEYFSKIRDFVGHNEKAVAMYIEKFNILAEREPDFELMRMPLIKLKEELGLD